MDITDAINMMRRFESLPEIYSATDKEVIKTIHAYFVELYETELRDKERMENNNDDSAYLTFTVDEKIAIHKKYWCNPALFYVPCSISGDPRHDWKLLSNIEILRNDDDDNQLFIFSAKYPYPTGGLSNRLYILKRIDGLLKIEHKLT